MKNILICVCGLTPQIITETLFCLSIKKKIKVDELYVVTTTRGRDVILGMDKYYNKREKDPYPPLRDEIKRMCEKYKKISYPKFEYNHIKVATDLSIELNDIRNDKANRLFPNTLCEFINEKSKDSNNILYCSISGGRKSMSVDMAFAMSLFGRENDKLLHVLTHENQEFKHFFPETKKEEKELELAELPYVRLRSIIGKETKNKSFDKMKYTDIVDFTQKELKLAFTDKMQINSNEIVLGEYKPFRLEPAAMKLYKYILEAKTNGEESVTVEDILNNCPHKFTKKGIIEKVTKIKKKFEDNITDIDLVGKFIIQGPVVFGTSSYGILADKSKFRVK
ncbi:MAG: TIGR02584 family CRISPR-associated protein [Bacteroidetes bacterium]|nr:TIGR02584 family CRISPR-associated protein [Bacteroidota bacterium]